MVLLAEKLYQHLHGDYGIVISKESTVQFLTSSEGWKSIALFSSIFIVSYLLEQEYLPMFLALYYKKALNNEHIDNYVLDFEHRLKILFKLKSLSTITNSKFVLKLYSDLLFMAITTTMWMIYFNKWWSYCIIAFTYLSAIPSFQAINTFMNKIQSSNIGRKP
jgi:hypothetical protein